MSDIPDFSKLTRGTNNTRLVAVVGVLYPVTSKQVERKLLAAQKKEGP